jgi:gas vesicle protein
MSTGNTILCFVAGAATGALAALLLAPDSGANTRAKIRKGASDAAGLAKAKILEGLDIIEKALEEK